MQIIRQTPSLPVSLPNFCNLGIMLRILLAVDGVSVLAALLRTPDMAAAWDELMRLSTFVQPVLLTCLLVLCGARKMLQRLSYEAGLLGVLAIALAATALIHGVTGALFGDAAISLPRALFFALAMTATLLFYFHLRARALSPAISEARLQALQARIRPHFLFNSINAVLSLIRSEPRRAETALEDMADLFRVLMADNRELSPLEREIQLCRQYLGLEQLRLGERLQVTWHVDKAPMEALIPPLVIQPLVENAVYHGIEPAEQPGEIVINAYRSRDQVHLVITNPYRAEGSHHAGNKMALSNIRERLNLHFDVEANLESSVGNGTYQVHITLPYMKE